MKLHPLEYFFITCWCGHLASDHPKYIEYTGYVCTKCDRWLESFENFRDDMYESYLKHIKEFGEKDTTLDRYPNVNGNYEPNNCRWATQVEQARNKRSSPKTTNYIIHRKWRKKLASLLWLIIKNKLPCVEFCNQYLGMGANEFRIYIRSLWAEGMSWNNYGVGKDKWQLGHIVDCNKFDLSIEEDRKKCFHYTNIKPQWWKDNHLQRKLDFIN